MKAQDVVKTALAMGLIRFYDNGESFSPFYGAARHDIWFSCGAGVNKTIDAENIDQYAGLRVLSIKGDTIEKII